MLKYSDNPPMTPLSDEGGSLFATREGNPDFQWSVAYTKPRQEKALAGDLLKQNISYFLPMVERVIVSGGRRRRALHPLFASYIFFQDDEVSRLSLMRTNRVVQVISPASTDQTCFRKEMQSLEKALLDCPGKIELHPRVVDGAHVRILSGAMKDIEGVVVQSNNRSKIWLQVTILGTGVLAEVPADLLEILD